MTTTHLCLIIGLLLGIAGVVGGLGGLLLTALFGAIGLAIGSQLEGRIDLRLLVGGRRGN